MRRTETDRDRIRKQLSRSPVGISRSARAWRLPFVSVRPFEQVVVAYGPMVLLVCRAVLGPVDAEDAWSETFLSALQAYPGLPADANVEAWLVTIAHRKAIDVVRAQARRPVVVEQVPEHPTTPVRAADSDGGLWDALRRLPDKQRQVVAYHYVAGLPYAEIAAIVGGSVDAARRAAADGIKNLRVGYAAAMSREGRA
jgi:RNA polymerase sigma factor (sigma-70 family)